MQEIEQQYTERYGVTFKTVYGPAGGLAKRIENGADPDLFFSANFEHPQRLATAGKALPPVVFARNQLCVTGRAGLGLTTSNVLDKMLDPALKLGTSTPKSDPGGDYTWEMFSRADGLRSGSFATLSGKARQLVGGPQSPAVPAGQDAVRYFFRQHEADMFVGYCSAQSRSRADDVEKVALPAGLEVEADYGLVVLNASRQAAALRFALFVLTPGAQATFAAYGFQPVSDAAKTLARSK
ncbi:molybdate ABC transporter substrate-binding protein [Paraburkholderia jirisanensis]